MVAEYAGLALALVLATRTLKRWPCATPWRDLLDAQRMRRLLSVNGHLLIRTLALMFTFALFTALGARQGSLILAANAVLMNFQYFMAFALDGFANAAEALIGRAIGSGDRLGLRHAWRRTLIWSAGVAVAFAAFYALIGTPLVRIMTDIESVRASAQTYLPWLVLLPLTSTWCFFYDGVFVGATLARQMRNSMLIATFVVFVPLALALSNVLGNHGIWLALNVFMLARGLAQHVIWQRTHVPLATDPVSNAR